LYGSASSASVVRVVEEVGADVVALRIGRDPVVDVVEDLGEPY
jgi:hypothetical protein